jgi:hypothetical protein
MNREKQYTDVMMLLPAWQRSEEVMRMVSFFTLFVMYLYCFAGSIAASVHRISVLNQTIHGRKSEERNSGSVSAFLVP